MASFKKLLGVLNVPVFELSIQSYGRLAQQLPDIAFYHRSLFLRQTIIPLILPDGSGIKMFYSTILLEFKNRRTQRLKLKSVNPIEIMFYSGSAQVLYRVNVVPDFLPLFAS